MRNYINIVQLILLMKNSFCIESVSTFREINESPLNRSLTKSVYSFSRDKRFKKPVVYCDNIYEKDSSFRRTGTSLGYGKKFDFTKSPVVSPGSKYMLKTIFDDNKSSRKGFSMYVHRQKIPDKGYIPLGPLRVPGSNKYDNLKLDRGHSYTLRKRTKVMDKTMTIDSQNDNPGSGTYENPQALSPKGKYTVSKHRGTGATVFNPRRSARFFQFKNEVPGPGRYEEINKLSNSGQYLLSRTHGDGKRLFDHEKRVVDFEKKAKVDFNPGPGSYRSPSQFGQYDGNVYQRFHRSIRNLQKKRK